MKEIEAQIKNVWIQVSILGKYLFTKNILNFLDGEWQQKEQWRWQNRNQSGTNKYVYFSSIHRRKRTYLTFFFLIDVLDDPNHSDPLTKGRTWGDY